jgi:hypothetical protein
MSKRCGTITHCHTLIRPAYCPDCLSREALPACKRMNSWIRDHQLWEHMNAHMNKYSWPHACPHLLCKREASAPQFKNNEELQFHLIDEHGFSRTRPGHRDGPASATHESSTLSRKRKSLNGDETLEQLSTRYFESLGDPDSVQDQESQFEELYSQFVRSPSPPCIAEAHDSSNTTCISEVVSPLIPKSQSTSFVAEDASSQCNKPDPDVHKLRLLIKPPKPPKITLRFTLPKDGPRAGKKRRRLDSGYMPSR